MNTDLRLDAQADPVTALREAIARVKESTAALDEKINSTKALLESLLESRAELSAEVAEAIKNTSPIDETPVAAPELLAVEAIAAEAKPEVKA